MDLATRPRELRQVRKAWNRARVETPLPSRQLGRQKLQQLHRKATALAGTDTQPLVLEGDRHADLRDQLAHRGATIGSPAERLERS